MNNISPVISKKISSKPKLRPTNICTTSMEKKRMNMPCVFSFFKSNVLNTKPTHTCPAISAAWFFIGSFIKSKTNNIQAIAFINL